LTVQFRRAFVAEFGDVRIAALQGEQTLRVRFSVERDKLPWPNNAELAIYNLSGDTRAKLTQGGPVVGKIQAGYEGDVKQIFFGLLDIIEHEKDGPNWVTRMSASDCGEKIKQTKVNTSFVKGTSVGTVIKAILKQLGLGEGNLSSFSADPELMRTLPHGGALTGNAVEELTYFLRAASLEFSIQDGKIQFTKIGEGAPNSTGPLISPATGMVGSAKLVRETATDLTRKKSKRTAQNTIQTVLGDTVDLITTVECKCLLNAALVPGVPFKVESETVNGEFVACATRHTGDTADQDWYTEAKGIPLGAAD
jgi:hypothetical protein